MYASKGPGILCERCKAEHGEMRGLFCNKGRRKETNTCSFSHSAERRPTRAACGGHKRRVKDPGEAMRKETGVWMGPNNRSRNSERFCFL